MKIKQGWMVHFEQWVSHVQSMHCANVNFVLQWKLFLNHYDQEMPCHSRSVCINQFFRSTLFAIETSSVLFPPNPSSLRLYASSSKLAENSSSGPRKFLETPQMPCIYALPTPGFRFALQSLWLEMQRAAPPHSYWSPASIDTIIFAFSSYRRTFTCALELHFHPLALGRIALQ